MRIYFPFLQGLENIIANPWISMKEGDIKSKLAKTKKQVNTVRNIRKAWTK